MKRDPSDFAAPLPVDEYPGARERGAEYGSALEHIMSSARIEIASALAWKTEAGWGIPERRRSFSYLWIFLSGEGRMIIEGETEPAVAAPGTALLVPENLLHRFLPKPGGTHQVLVFHFLFRYLGAVDIFSLLNLRGRLDPLPARAEQTALELCGAYARRDPLWREYIAAGVLTLLYPSLLRSAARLERDGYPYASSGFIRLVPAFAFIRRKLTDPGIRVQDIADAAGVSQVYLRRLFAGAVGKTPQEYLLKERLNHALDLLTHSGITVQTAAEESGFESPSYFYRVFRKTYGVSPGEYRKRPQV